MGNRGGETSVRDWLAAKEYVKKLLVDRARLNEVISIRGVFMRIAANPSLPNTLNVFDLLVEISIDEHREGRGLLTALVVRGTNEESHAPEDWFISVARGLGYEFDDERVFWALERDRIFDMYAQ